MQNRLLSRQRLAAHLAERSRWVPRWVFGVLVVVSASAGAQARQASPSPTDGAVIDAALAATALPRVASLSRSGPAPQLMVDEAVVSTCRGVPRTFCLDGPLKALAIVIGRAQSAWPAETVQAISRRNADPHSLHQLKLSSGAIAPGPSSTARGPEPRAVVRVSLPAYVSDRAAVVVQLSYGASSVWGVLLRKTTGGWTVVDTVPLGQS